MRRDQEQVVFFNEPQTAPTQQIGKQPNGLALVIHHDCAEAAELSKLADTTYRDVNIGLANQFLRLGICVTGGRRALESALQGRTDRVVFVDFTPPEYSAFRRYNQASPYRDIAMFVLFVRAKYPPQLLYLAFRPKLRELTRAFLKGYFRDAPDRYDPRMLDRCMNELLDSTYLGKTFNARYLRRSRLFRTDDLAPG